MSELSIESLAWMLSVAVSLVVALAALLVVCVALIAFEKKEARTWRALGLDMCDKYMAERQRYVEAKILQTEAILEDRLKQQINEALRQKRAD